MSESRELLEMRLIRYLHYGAENASYKCGDLNHKKSYSLESVPSLIKLINGEDPKKVVDIILKVRKEETSILPDCIIFAAVVCINHQDYHLQHAVYINFRTICQTTRDMFLFVSFYKKLKVQNGVKGGGNGFKRALAEWYLVWMPFDLADILLQQRGHFGFTHADVLKMAHVKPISLEQQMLFLYAARGLKAVTTKYCESPNKQVIELLEYINSVESFKKIADPEVAAKALAVELHNMERVQAHLLKCQEVWNELIPNMDVATVLDNLQRISILGFLKSNNVTVMRVVDVLNNVYKAEQFKGHPTRVYIELLTYEKAATHCLQIAKKLNHPISKVTPARKAPKTNILIKNALTTFYYSLFKYQKPTGLRYFIAVDVRAKMFSDKSHHCMHLSPIEAAQALCLSLVRVEPDKNVKIGTFSELKGEIKMLSFTKDSELSEYTSKFTEAGLNPGPATVVSAIHFAEVNKMEVDMFIVLSNFMVHVNGTKPALNKYRTSLQLPNCKLVTCSLSGNIKCHKDVEAQNMLSVIGFDHLVCRLIESYARGCF